LAVGLAAAGAIGALALAAAHHRWPWPALGVIVLAWLFAHRQLTLRRRDWFGDRLDNDHILVERAGHLARLFPAAFVVMGHTHVPEMVSVAEGAATYVNVGSWHEAEPDGEGSYRAARTHLVIHPAETGPTAEFLAWGNEGPKKFVRAANNG
jgi:hypothetical protein